MKDTLITIKHNNNSITIETLEDIIFILELENKKIKINSNESIESVLNKINKLNLFKEVSITDFCNENERKKTLEIIKKFIDCYKEIIEEKYKRSITIEEIEHYINIEDRGAGILLSRIHNILDKKKYNGARTLIEEFAFFYDEQLGWCTCNLFN